MSTIHEPRRAWRRRRAPTARGATGTPTGTPPSRASGTSSPRWRPRLPVTALQRKLMRDVWRLRSQVASIASVVACGVAIVVAMYGTLRSIETTLDAYYRRYRFADVFASATRVPMPVAARLGAIAGVRQVETRAVLRVALDVPGLALPAGALLLSVPDDHPAILNAVHLRAGRLVRPRSTSEVVVSGGFAQANRIGIGDSVGAVLDGRWRRLHVVGIGTSPEYVWELAAAGGFTADERAFGVLWMSRAAVDAAAGLRGAFDDVSLALAPEASEPAVRAAVDTLLAPYGGLGAVGRDKQRSNRIVNDELRSLRVFGTLLPAIFLLVAAFLLNVVLARLVATQRGEIAALKAFGYTDREVGIHYLSFAAAAVVLGTVAGLAFGVWIGGGYTGLYGNVFRLPGLRFHPSSAVGATGLAVLASCGAAVAGALGAVGAAVRLPPAEALRPESPARFRPLLLERLGLGAVASPALRMVLRNVERQPLRALSSVVGIALAIGLLAGTLALFDAAYYIADVQFRLAQREDISVTFTRDLAPSAGVALGRMPGVLAVEAFRAVPVRVRRGAVVRSVAVSGVDGHETLRRLVDQRGAVFTVPPSGVVMTTALARRLGTRVGDTLRLELVARGDGVRRAVVVGLLDELLGSNLYMERTALDRLVGDGPRVSGAYLRVDPATEPRVLARLKTVPTIAGAASRPAMIAAWERQMAESVRISGSLVVAFGIVIALGVVYNGARIALSERGRELASLRVLGFSRREVATLLLGEQGALLVAAIPLGVALGVGLAVLIARSFESENQRFPMVFAPRTYAGAIAVVVMAAAVAGLAMRRRLDRLDLVGVLKTRE